MLVVCIVKTQCKMQDNQDTGTSTDEVQRENKRIKKIPPGGMGVYNLCVLCVVQVETSATCRSLVQGNPT